MNATYLVPLLAFAACSLDPEVASTALSALPPTLYDVGARPVSVAVADFNGDKRLDVAVANGDGATVSILIGDGAGRLAPATNYAAGTKPSDVDAADLDGDGHIDLVIANHETSGVTVLRNRGDGTFAPMSGSPFQTGAVPHLHGVATADFDGDGRIDIAVESADDRTIPVLRGTASGFAAAVRVPVETMPYYRVGVGRITGANKVLVPGHGDNTVRVIERASNGFRLSSMRIALAGQPWMVAGGDVNGDAVDDVIVVQTDAVSIWLASGATFTQAAGSPMTLAGATEVALGDIDGDGMAEVAIGPWEGRNVTVRTGRSGAMSIVPACDRPIGLAIADLDGDGRGELIAACPLVHKVAVVKIGIPSPR